MSDAPVWCTEQPLLSLIATILMARSRGGCFGSLIQLAGVLVLCGVVLVVFTALFQPWGFYLGGTFHLIPYWQGWGTMRSQTGEEYVVFVGMRPGSPTRLGSAYLSGDGYVCTRKHERIRLRMNALMGRHLGRNTDGEAISVDMYGRAALLSQNPTRRPRIDLRGRWRGNSLVMTDGGSLSQAFLPDGSVNRGHLPAARDTVPITITAGTMSQFEAACRAVR